MSGCRIVPGLVIGLLCWTAPASAILIDTGAGRVGEFLLTDDGTRLKISIPTPDGKEKVSEFLHASIKIVHQLDVKRLEALSPDNPKGYRDYADELARQGADPEARYVAMRLYLLAVKLAPAELGGSSLLRVSALASTPAEARKYRAMAFLLDPKADADLLRAEAVKPAQPAKLQARALEDFTRALQHYRAGQIKLASDTAKHEGVDKIFSRAPGKIDQKTFLQWCAEANCTTCRLDGTVACPTCQGKGTVRNVFNQVERCTTCKGKRWVTCPDCGGTHIRDPLPENALRSVLRLELWAMDQHAAGENAGAKNALETKSWSAVLQARQLSPVLPLSLETITQFDLNKCLIAIANGWPKRHRHVEHFVYARVTTREQEPMFANVTCPTCQHKYSLPEGEMGTRQICPSCNSPFFAGASVGGPRPAAASAALQAGYAKTMMAESAPPIKYNCPRCKAPLEAPVSEAGTKKNCPNCTQRHQVPAAPVPEVVAAPANLNKTMLADDASAAPPRPPIKYNCPNCKKPLEAPAEQAGTKTNCPSCKQRLQIPAASVIAANRNKTMLAEESVTAASAAPGAVPASSVPGSIPVAAVAAPAPGPWAAVLTPKYVIPAAIVLLLLLLYFVPAFIRGGKTVDSEALAKSQIEVDRLKAEIELKKLELDKQAKAQEETRRQIDEMMRNARAQEDKMREAERQRLREIDDEDRRAALAKRQKEDQQKREMDRLELEKKQQQLLEETTRKLEETKKALDASQQKQQTIIQQPPPVIYYPPYNPYYYRPWWW